MRPYQFDCSLREQEAAPPLGSMPQSPSNPDLGGGENKRNDLTARNTILGISPDQADKDRESKVFDLHQALFNSDTKTPIFPHHNILSWDTLPVTAEKLGDDKWEVTFRYEECNPEMLTDNNFRKVDPDIVENKTEIIDDEMMDWIEGHGYMGGSPGLGKQDNSSPMGDAMSPAPGMPGAGPMPGAGMMGTGPNPMHMGGGMGGLV
jgi:hypothetical protein